MFLTSHQIYGLLFRIWYFRTKIIAIRCFKNTSTKHLKIDKLRHFGILN